MYQRIKVVLCNGRHDVGVEEAIYKKEILDPFDFAYLRKKAKKKISRIARGYKPSETIVDLYVTGLKTALIIAMQVIKEEGFVHCNLLHWNLNKRTYVKQRGW